METTTILSTASATEPLKRTLVLFSWYDYTIFFLMLGFSSVIGIYFGCFGTKQSTTKEYLLGGKSMNVVPIVISLVASHTSGTVLLALPAEIYKYGATYWLLSFSMVAVVLVTAYVYLPVFFRLQITSTYEYIEMRFDSRARNLASFIFTISRFLFLPIVIYIPALACSSATGFNVHLITPLICGICIFYTTIGGLKAVVWTDTFQFVITVGSLAAVLCLGMSATGGFSHVWSTAVEGHRLDLFDFSLDPTKRDSFWTTIVGFTTHWTVITAVDQGCVQKFVAVPTQREAKKVIWLYGLGISLIKTMGVLTGLTLYAKYGQCDLFSTGAIKTDDQMVPYFLMEVAGSVPGLPGLFTVGVVSAGLSTLSAALNSMAATLYKDFISKFMPKDTTEKTASYTCKLIVVVCGAISTSLVFVVEHLGGIMPLAIAFGGIALGPTFGLFSLGMLVPRSNSKGAFWGTVVGLIATSYIVFTAQYYKTVGIIHHDSKPVSTLGCANATSFTYANASSFAMESKYEPFVLFRISHYYYTIMGTIITMVAGYFFSLCFKGEEYVRPELISPLMRWLIPKEKQVVKDVVEYTAVEKETEPGN